MAIQSVLSAGEKADLEILIRDHNGKTNQGRNPQQSLGRDDFLKILLTQLSHQDPTAPMEDKEFIAQMAQFSTLEQMTGIAGDFSRLTEMITNTEAAGVLGKTVELNVGEEIIQGAVKAVSRGEKPQILVNGTYYEWDKVVRVFEGE